MRLFTVLLLFVPCYIISASIHELGHIFMGMANGFKFYLFVVGPFGLKRNDNNKVELYIEKNPALWGGIGASLPQNDNEKNYAAFSKVLLAGPLLSIICSIIFIPIGLTNRYMFFILVGFMATGKTTVGKLLARTLNFEFIDTDKLVEEMEGMSISSIFKYDDI